MPHNYFFSLFLSVPRPLKIRLSQSLQGWLGDISRMQDNLAMPLYKHSLYSRCRCAGHIKDHEHPYLPHSHLDNYYRRATSPCLRRLGDVWVRPRQSQRQVIAKRRNILSIQQNKHNNPRHTRFVDGKRAAHCSVYRRNMGITAPCMRSMLSSLLNNLPPPTSAIATTPLPFYPGQQQRTMRKQCSRYHIFWSHLINSHAGASINNKREGKEKRKNKEEKEKKPDATNDDAAISIPKPGQPKS